MSLGSSANARRRVGDLSEGVLGQRGAGALQDRQSRGDRVVDAPLPQLRPQPAAMDGEVAQRPLGAQRVPVGAVVDVAGEGVEVARLAALRYDNDLLAPPAPVLAAEEPIEGILLVQGVRSLRRICGLGELPAVVEQLAQDADGAKGAPDQDDACVGDALGSTSTRQRLAAPRVLRQDHVLRRVLGQDALQHALRGVGDDDVEIHPDDNIGDLTGVCRRQLQLLKKDADLVPIWRPWLNQVADDDIEVVAMPVRVRALVVDGLTCVGDGLHVATRHDLQSWLRQ
mmetsp:Transcript_94727/g.265251  ORF Transcript_94727/g.265251 Transcript_94727/m.265251 type:complete len:284 (+) Transcript_94727:90-941(+)